MSEISVSYVVICRDEERTISRCLHAIEENANQNDEIIVIDTGSKDKTLSIISKEFPNVKVELFKWINDFSAARNKGIKLAKKNWIFFIDADETLQEGSGFKVKRDIKNALKITSKLFVMVPKIINYDGKITYNTGRILPNDSRITFFGMVHEYPIIDGDIHNEHYKTIALPDVVVRHDGYKAEVMKNKNKRKRNSVLDKKMMEIMPDSIRYKYFYYHDSKTIIGNDKYANGLKSTFLMNKNNRISKFAACELIIYYIKQKKYILADQYINELSKHLNNEDQRDLKWELALVSAVNEYEKIQAKQVELLKTLVAIKINHEEELNEICEKGMNYDELIGFMNLSLGNFHEATQISDYLNKNGYPNQLSIELKKYRRNQG